MKVIGLKGTPESRKTNWLDLLEAKQGIESLKTATTYKERRSYAIDKDYYERYLSSYVA